MHRESGRESLDANGETLIILGGRFPITLTGSIVADFRAKVELSNWGKEASGRTRVVVTDEKIGFATDGTKRAIALSDVFDIVQGVSPRTDTGSTGTVTLAFRTGERRATASISAGVETLVKFQRLLYQQLLNGTEVVAKHRRNVGEAEPRSHKLRLAVTASQIRLESDGEEPIVIRRGDVTEFKTPADIFDGNERKPVVVTYAETDGRVAKTAVSMPSFRSLNLFGRYLRADLLSTDAIGYASEQEGTIDLLLIDDDPHDLEMAELFLKQQSDRFSTTSVSSAAGGLDVLAGGTDGDPRVDCVVSDYQMPGMDGIEFLKEVRERYRALPFILYTGQGSEEVAKRAILDDVTDYVEKDVGLEQYEILAERVLQAVR